MKRFTFVIMLSQAVALAQSPKIVYATFAGTGPRSSFNALTVDFAGFAYVAGFKPDSSGGYSGCTFLIKLNQSGTAAAWSVCLPLLGVSGLAIDGAGSIYVSGYNSESAPSPNSSSVMKLTPDAQTVIYSTIIPGGYAASLTLDRAGNAYVAGTVTGNDFPTTSGPANMMTLSAHGFAAKLDPDGVIQFARILDLRLAWDIAVDSIGQVWIVGTSCRNTNCAGLALAVRKLSADGTSVLFSMNRGGNGPGGLHPTFSDSASAVAVDASDSVWVLGVDETGSIPTTPNAIFPERPSLEYVPTAYAMKLASSGEVSYATYISGLAMEPIGRAAVDGAGNLFFAVVNTGSKSTIVGLPSDGSNLLIDTPFDSFLSAVAVDGNGGLFVAGGPSELGFVPCPTTPGAYQPSTGRQLNVCLARFDMSQLASSEAFYPLNAASLQAGSVSPGEVITLFGSNLPANPVVTFEGLTAPVVSSDQNKITGVVPFGISTGWTTLSVDGVGGFSLGVWPTAPGLFSSDGTGIGQLDARDQEGAINSIDNPAPAGSIITIFMTGAGAMSPAIVDGQLGPAEPPFPAPVQPIYASINGIAAKVVRASQAPGKIAGIVRVDIEIPNGTVSGDAVVMIGVGNSDPASFPFQPRTTIAVQ